MTTQYWIAQHIEDLFRNEPRNVGVFVKVGDRLVSRFFGETNNQIDGRKLRGLSYPEVYKQWVEYWRNQLSQGNIDALIKHGGSHYRVVSAGHVTDTEHDSPEDVLNYLYALLVSEGGFKEAVNNEEVTEQSAVPLEDDISRSLHERNLLTENEDLMIRHPVRRGVSIVGSSNIHYTPAFVQENGRLYVIESVDFTKQQKKASRDHAGWAAYMFRDVRALKSTTQPISVVKFLEEDRNLEEVESGLRVLENESQIVNWFDESARNAFIEERKAIADTV